MNWLKSMEHFHESIQGNGTVLMFTAGWCPDCVVIEPHLTDIEAAFPELKFIKVNRDDFIDLCQELDIFGIPSFLVYKGGKEAHRFVSKDRKTIEEIVTFLEEAKAR